MNSEPSIGLTGCFLGASISGLIMIGCLACALFPRLRRWAQWDDYAGPPVSAVSFCAMAGVAGGWCVIFLAEGLRHTQIVPCGGWLGVLSMVALMASARRDWSRWKRKGGK